MRARAARTGERAGGQCRAGGALGIGNSAGGQALVAPDSMASVYGPNLAFTARGTASVNLGTSLAGTGVTVTDAAGVTRAAPLIYVSPYKVNFLIPPGTAAGTATVATAGASGTVPVAPVAPGLFTMGATNVAAATAARSPPAVARPSPSPSSTAAVERAVRYLLHSTLSRRFISRYTGPGFRASSPAAVTCTVGGVSVPVAFAGPEGQYTGFDQVNVALPAQLHGQGTVSVLLTVDGRAANAVEIAVGG